MPEQVNAQRQRWRVTGRFARRLQRDALVVLCGLLVLLGLLAPGGRLAAAAQPTSASASASTAASAPVSPLPAWAASAIAAPPAEAGAVPVELRLNQRLVLALQAPLMGRSAQHRVQAAQAALRNVLARGGPGEVDIWRDPALPELRGLRVDGQIVLYLAPLDVAALDVADLDARAEAVRQALQRAVDEAREMHDARLLAAAAGRAALATALAYAVLRLLRWARWRFVQRVGQALQTWQGRHESHTLVSTYAPYLRNGLRGLANAVGLLLLLALGETWLTYVLDQFAYTRPWAESLRAGLLGLLLKLALAGLDAVPGLLTAVVVFALAHLAARGWNSVLLRVERGQLRLSGLDADTAGPTRRVGLALIWLFALAMAYPFLPGANSEAFKGVSVLAGLMLSLGASGVVGQVVSGLSLMYSRTLRVGEYVRIGDVEGTVRVVGLFSTKVHTGMGEEVSLPNSVVFSQSVRNYSRLVQDGNFMLQTTVTIGYATPWRQVHAMLLEAATRCSGVAQQPPPYVVQTALSDFYVEYRLCAQSNRSAPQRRIEAINQLHGHVQDVFNENGVQIMSPHYMADPPSAQVVPPAQWSPPLVRPQPPAAQSAGAPESAAAQTPNSGRFT